MSILKIKNLSKTYDSGFEALKSVDLEVKKGEIFALLGPNGAGKTTLISTICGLVTPSSGIVEVGGYDILKDYRRSREMIGLVPQEISMEGFEKLWPSMRYSRQLFGKPRNDAFLEQILQDLALMDKRNEVNMNLSGGMKRRVMIAKALSHEPAVLFLDEPTAGVDVSLRKDMWDMVRRLRDNGTTVFLTTHYIEEAEEMADRVGIINNGEILLVEETKTLMRQMGKKVLRVYLEKMPKRLPASLKPFDLERDQEAWIYRYDVRADRTGIRTLLNAFHEAGLTIADLETEQSSLEEIFVELVGGQS